MPTPRRTLLLTLGSLLVGLALGIVVSLVGSPGALASVTWIEPVGLVWVNAIRMTVIPLIVASLVVAVSDTGARAIGRLGTRSVVVFVLLLSVIAALTTLTAPLIFDRLTVDAAAAAAVRGGVEAGTALPTMPSFSDWLIGIVPANPVRALADGAMLSVVVVTLAFGLALGRVEAARRAAVVEFFRGVADAMTTIVGWLLVIAPVGVFALAFTVAARLGVSVVGAVGFYIVAYSAMLVVATLIVYLAIVLFARVPLARFARAALPAQIVAVTTRSSMAALPVMVTSAEETLQLPRAVTSFALPFAVSTFRLNQAVSWVVMALFAAKLYGVDLGATAVVTLAVTSVLMSFSVPGIPSASLFVVAPFFSSVGIPPEAIGVLIALDLIPDVFKTLLNVTGQLGAVAVVGSRPAERGRS
jgi:Na+/H+-dicarboxylate symporter